MHLSTAFLLLGDLTIATVSSAIHINYTNIQQFTLQCKRWPLGLTATSNCVLTFLCSTLRMFLFFTFLEYALFPVFWFSTKHARPCLYLLIRLTSQATSIHDFALCPGTKQAWSRPVCAWSRMEGTLKELPPWKTQAQVTAGSLLSYGIWSVQSSDSISASGCRIPYRHALSPRSDLKIVLCLTPLHLFFSLTAFCLEALTIL